MFLYVVFSDANSVTTPPTVILHDINASRLQLGLNLLRVFEAWLKPYPVFFRAEDVEVIWLSAL